MKTRKNGMMQKKIKVTTVVVSYNSCKSGFFPDCLNCIKKVKLIDKFFWIEHNVIVVDSNSSDQTTDFVKKNFPDFQLIESDRNLGYAGGNNFGIKQALRDNSDFIAVVTHDVCVHEDWLLKCIHAMNNDEKIGVVQPLLLLNDEPDLINSTGNQIHFLGYGYANDYRTPLSVYNNTDLVDIPYFSGAVILFSAKVLRVVGTFDEEMWMYNEDQDLGWRIWLKGYRNVLAPQSRAFHKYEFSRSISKLYYMDRNRLLVVMQNYKLATLFLIVPALLLNELAGLFLAINGGWFKQKILVWQYFLKKSSWIMLIRKRRKVQSSRTEKEKNIIKKFTGKILFQDLLSPVIKYVANPVLSVYWFVVKSLIFW